MTRPTLYSRWALQHRLKDPRVQHCRGLPSRPVPPIWAPLEVETPTRSLLWKAAVQDSGGPLTEEVFLKAIRWVEDHSALEDPTPKVYPDPRMILQATTSPRSASPSEICSLRRNSRLRLWMRR